MTERESRFPLRLEFAHSALPTATMSRGCGAGSGKPALLRAEVAEENGRLVARWR